MTTNGNSTTHSLVPAGPTTVQDLVDRLEELLSLRHYDTDDGRWDGWSDQIEQVERVLLAAPQVQLREALDLLLGVLHGLVEGDGISRPEDL